LSIYGSGH